MSSRGRGSSGRAALVAAVALAAARAPPRGRARRHAPRQPRQLDRIAQSAAHGVSIGSADAELSGPGRARGSGTASHGR